MIDYLTEKTTYYKILSLINNNYELFENLTDSLVFDVSSQSDEINYYLNENEGVTLSLIASRIVRNFFEKSHANQAAFCSLSHSFFCSRRASAVIRYT